MGLQSGKLLCYVPVLTADCDKYSCAGPDSRANIEPVLNAQRRYGGGAYSLEEITVKGERLDALPKRALSNHS